MSALRFSRLAETDLAGIAAYTILTWGEKQADRYLGQLDSCCRKIARNPALGRACDDVRAGLRRYEQGKHVIFFRKKTGAIVITRILHQGMLPDKCLFEEN